MKKNFWQKIKKPILALAPMAGVTDSAFRQVCREQGADVVYTEMISADGLFYDSKKTLAFLKFAKKEKPVVVQLFGKYPERFTKAAQICERAGFDGIDINFGCPAKKVTAHGGGVTLMRDFKKCRVIILAVLAGTKLPVSIKIRSSINKNSKRVKAVDFVKKIKDLPISAIMIHGRSYENPFGGEIDYEMIAKVKKEFGGIVLGNGGINTPEEAKRMMDLTGVDGLGLARGVNGKPWLFNQVKNYLENGKYKNITQAQIGKVILRHGELAKKEKGDHGLVELRKHLLWYVSGWSNAKALRAELVKVENISQIKKIFGKKK